MWQGFVKGLSKNKTSQQTRGAPTTLESIVAQYSQPEQAYEDDLFAASETVTSLARMDEIAALLAEKREYRRTIFLRKTIAGGGFPPPAWLLWSALPQSDRRV